LRNSETNGGTSRCDLHLSYLSQSLDDLACCAADASGLGKARAEIRLDSAFSLTASEDAGLVLVVISV